MLESIYIFVVEHSIRSVFS